MILSMGGGGGTWSRGVPGPGGSAAGRGGSAPGGCLVETPLGRLLPRAVRILLECILVFHVFIKYHKIPGFFQCTIIFKVFQVKWKPCA